jgi:hypothetical protein
LLAVTIIWDAFYMLKADISGFAKQDRYCIIRNICMLIAMIAFNYSLWYVELKVYYLIFSFYKNKFEIFDFSIQTYHRFVSVVHSQQSSLRSISLYKKIIVIQWLLCPFLILPLILNEQIVYQPGSFVCQTSFSNTIGFFYLFTVSYSIPIIFIIILHISIVHYLKKYWQFHRHERLTGTDIGYPFQRIALTTFVLIISYFPYGVFFVIEHVQVSAFPYAQKVAMIFAAISFTSTLTFILGFNRAVRNSCCLIHHRTVHRHIVYKSSNKLPEQVFL